MRSRNRIIGSLNAISKKRTVVSDGERDTLLAIGRETGTIIERIAAETEAGTMADNLRSLFNTIDEMVFIIAPDGTIRKINNTVTKRLGFTHAELEGQDVLALFAPEHQEDAAETMRCMLAGTQNSCLLPLAGRDGTHIEVETRTTIGQWEGQEALFGVSRDITNFG